MAASEFIDKLPQKYDTVVGERGLTLSGQADGSRIAIARGDYPELVHSDSVDEPGSGLDAASEQLVFDALDRLMKNKTSIVIAHRLSTIRAASCIYVLKDGRIVEQGTHDELIAHEDGLYRQLHDIQFQETEEPVVATTSS